MPPVMNHQVLLKDRPVGEPAPHHFQLIERPIGEVAAGWVLRQTLFLSLDPYMRGRMNAGKSYAAPVELGAVMVGATVSRVVESKNSAFSIGDLVLGHDGWQEYGLSDGGDLEKLPQKPWPPSYWLGVLGMPGMTAYVGLLDIGRPKSGETVVISAAAGAVGQVACQIAKIKGCRVIGIAGSDAKCDYLITDLGCDGAVNYKTMHVLRSLKKLCPAGIDIYFDNVGGAILEAILRLMNLHGRIPLIGLISQYNATEFQPGPNLAPVLINRLLIQGMIVSDHADRREAFLRDMSLWLEDGQMKYRETIVDGLEKAPQAFMGLFKGENFGKLLVRISY